MVLSLMSKLFIDQREESYGVIKVVPLWRTFKHVPHGKTLCISPKTK
jgi:hypothetical protein